MPHMLATFGFLFKHQEYWIERMVGKVAHYSRLSRTHSELSSVNVLLLLFARSTCKRDQPNLCQSIDELMQGDAANPERLQRHKLHVDLIRVVGANTIGSPVSIEAHKENDLCTSLIEALPDLLSKDSETSSALGWRRASKDVLKQIHEGPDHHLIVKMFRQARLRNNDKLSSGVDNTQRGDNKWALVVYQQDENTTPYMCVLKIDYFLQVQVKTFTMPGFHDIFLPAGEEGDHLRNTKHLPYEVAVGGMWLAHACDAGDGAVGCQSGVHADGRSVPDLIRVKNMGTDQVLKCYRPEDLQKIADGRDRISTRYFGVFHVHLSNIDCLLAPAADPSHAGGRIFLTTQQQSNKG